ncbi:hypothetical protein [Micromonospora sp. WMMC250]|uniref:hypothetical protein n=1 Tax=Micromonospora sp. WMMC250 TaxID=3014781 RepID=UPI0022B5E8A4|nr:hypothetical protein [Micromonospora sp. WMMC250]MCZ7373259.1 hypothetical protein [Micromonospora sp. WMMC250]MCZ7373298.1 hypothetical protein [Micromonospora sp. WMMC250]MCZ7379909.1 hypothetical protein [Micromonospora sp. WMMC250]
MWPVRMPLGGSPLARCCALWAGLPCLALHVDVVHAAILITPTPAGAHVVGTREELPLPAAARYLCGITAGEPVLLAALPGRNLLVVHASHTIAEALADLHARILRNNSDGR